MATLQAIAAERQRLQERFITAIRALAADRNLDDQITALGDVRINPRQPEVSQLAERRIMVEILEALATPPAPSDAPPPADDPDVIPATEPEPANPPVTDDPDVIPATQADPRPTVETATVVSRRKINTA